MSFGSLPGFWNQGQREHSDPPYEAWQRCSDHIFYLLTLHWVMQYSGCLLEDLALLHHSFSWITPQQLPCQWSIVSPALTLSETHLVWLLQGVMLNQSEIYINILPAAWWRSLDHLWEYIYSDDAAECNVRGRCRVKVCVSEVVMAWWYFDLKLHLALFM